jgi:transcriptional regulator with XRE-family HTH domain
MRKNVRNTVMTFSEMQPIIDKISHKPIGLRVKAACEAKGWTQHRLAQGLGLNDRQSVSDIENGKRTLRVEEMLAPTDLLDQDIEFFIDPFAVAGEAQFNRRADTGVAEDSLDDFERKAGQWIGLLRWLREQRDNWRCWPATRSSASETACAAIQPVFLIETSTREPKGLDSMQRLGVAFGLAS